MKDEGNHQGAVDKSFSEQRIRIVDANYIIFFVRKIGPIHIAEPGLTAGRQVADEIQVNLEIFHNHCTSKRFDFMLRLTKVQHHYSSRNAFQVFFWVKSIVKLVYESTKIHEASLLLSTIVLNDVYCFMTDAMVVCHFYSSVIVW